MFFTFHKNDARPLVLTLGGFLDYYPGDIGFDPLGLKPEDPEELNLMITKELQNGRLAMLAAAGFLAQEAVDGKGILEHLGVSL